MLSNLTLFPRSAFVYVKLSGLRGRCCPAETAPAIKMTNISTNPPVRKSAPATGMGEMTSHFRSGPRLLFSHWHCPRDAGVRSLLPTRIWPFSFGDVLLPSVLSRLCWLLLAAIAGLFLLCEAAQPEGHLPHLSGQTFSTCRGALGTPLCSVGEANPLHFSPAEALGDPKLLACWSLGGCP